MKCLIKFCLMGFLIISLSACETRSNAVALDAYKNKIAYKTGPCQDSLQTVQAGQFRKNVSLVAIPVAGVLSGGLTLFAAALTNAGITIDDEVNANRIARECELENHLKNGEDIIFTVAQNATVNALTGTVSPINSPVQPTGIE